MHWVTTLDVIDRWVGDNKPDDDDTLQQLVDDAETILASELPDLADRIASEDVGLDEVRIVVSRMVHRVLRNPSGVRQETETTGPFAVNRTFAGASPGDMSVTDEDRRLLGYRGERPAAFSVPMGGAPGWLGAGWGPHAW